MYKPSRGIEMVFYAIIFKLKLKKNAPNIQGVFHLILIKNVIQ
jgi:hypothetical protein